jgi:kumamolisin
MRRAALAAVFAIAACSSVAPAAAPHPPSWPVQASRPVPSLARAISSAADLGVAGPQTEVSLNFALRLRNPAELKSVLASGRTLTAEEYQAEFGPDPRLVEAAVAYLDEGGLASAWRPGSAIITADGPAPVVDAVLGVEIDRYRQADGSTFYAALGAPLLTGLLAAVASSVSGLDSYRRSLDYAVAPGGLKPPDVLRFYNIKPLRDRGLDGGGETILFPEIETIPQKNLDDLEKFAGEFGLPSFNGLLTIKTDPSWGTPEKPVGEAVLDLEIAHEIAPKAKLVAYVGGPQFSFMDRVFDRMVSDHLGSIISESLGACEPGSPSGHRDTYQSIEDRAVAEGMTHFVASGDSGAYTCGQDNDPADSFPATLPTVTAVGGTTVFESTQGNYFREFAWGAAIDQSGSGGGPSLVYPIPDWQRAVESADGHGFRQVPDVAADADPQTGFHIVFGGEDTQIGGTSAATPMWAGLIALVDQDLVSKKLREVGFANPAIYWMGANLSKFAAPPFHDIVAGNNLAFTARAGWDFATGWGSPDGQAIDAAWITYVKSGGA